MTPRKIAALGTAAGVLVSCCTAAASNPVYTDALLQNGEQSGFHASGKIIVEKTPYEYVKASGEKGTQAKKDVALLTQDGFAGGAAEELVAPLGRQDDSMMLMLSSPRAAKQFADEAYKRTKVLQEDKTAHFTKFTIPGVPSAMGLTDRDGNVASSNVYWVSGDCVFGSGLFLPRRGSSTVKQINAPVIVGVKSQNGRVLPYCGP